MEKSTNTFIYEHPGGEDFRNSHDHENFTLNNNDPRYQHVPDRISHPDINGAHRKHSTGWGTENFRRDNGIVLTPEMFEKLYLNPGNNNTGDLRTTFGNPTPIALVGVLLTASPLSCELMGLRGAGGGGAATTGAYYFIGGFLMSLGGILEFFLANTFSFVVFCSFGGFWLTLGATLTPAFNAYGAYSPDPSNPSLGLESAGFHASFGFLLLFAGLMIFIYLICALRTNVVFVAIFIGLLLLVGMLLGSYWNAATGNTEMAQRLQFLAGVFGLITTSGGWYIFAAQMLASVDFPFQLPVGDLSHFITPYSEKVKQKQQQISA